MHFEGAIEAPVPPARFYSFVTDPEKVISILPDVQESKVVDATHFAVKSKLGTTYMKGVVSMNFEISEKRKDASVKTVGRGQGVQSTVDLTLQITLEESGGGTRASWSAEAKVGGLLASVGSRLINGIAEKYIRQITETLRKKVASPQ